MSDVRPVTDLGPTTWPEVPTGSVLLVPLGSCEQHGPHLPFDTDTRIAVALASNAAMRVDGCVVAPAVAIGASGEHESFPGTLSIGTVAMEAVLIELGRSALPPPGSARPAPFVGVVFVNGHGGNVEAVGRALALLGDEGRAVTAWHPRVPDGDSHAGRTETSMLLRLDPGLVRMDRAEVGSTARWRDIGEAVVAQGLRAVTANGVLGDPTGASAEEGARLVDRLVDDLCDHIRSWRATLSP